MKKLSKGFTLIELLVVIAIIGILASMIIVSLGDARQKAKEANLKAIFTQARTQGEIFYSDNNDSYFGYCGSPKIAQWQSDVAQLGVIVGGDCAHADQSWAADAQMLDGTWWCVDSTGFFGQSDPSGNHVSPVLPVVTVCDQL